MLRMIERGGGLREIVVERKGKRSAEGRSQKGRSSHGEKTPNNTFAEDNGKSLGKIAEAIVRAIANCTRPRKGGNETENKETRIRPKRKGI